MRVLIVEDSQAYQEALSRILRKHFGDDVSIDQASDYTTAHNSIQSNSYDLVTVDLELPEGSVELPVAKSRDYGMKLLQELHESRDNEYCIRLVITVYSSQEAGRAQNDYGAFAVLDKHDFDRDAIVDIIKTALFERFIKKIRDLQSKRYLLSSLFTSSHMIGLELHGHNRYQGYTLSDPKSFDNGGNFAGRGDRLNLFFTSLSQSVDQQKWREEARSIGRGLYNSLTTVREFNGGLGAARSLPEKDSRLWLRFRGPRPSLDVPFELLHDGVEYLALRYPIYRQILYKESMLRKVMPFHELLQKLRENQEKLRFLLIASSAGGPIGAVDEEVKALKRDLLNNLPRIGIESDIELVSSSEATYEQAESLFRRSRLHIIHYAGYRYTDEGPTEESCLFFRTENGLKPMQASTVKTLLRESETHLFYLNLCRGVQTTEQIGHGGFLDLIDNLVQAQLPAVMGHRWAVANAGAKDLALTFYTALFSGLSIQDALFQARTEMAHKLGRDNETWASPILVVQIPGSVPT